ncbi:MAG: hypothetical protein M9894_31600 [Planctomycetes bacterium]|nr:hypothetical protein [Planctomycetota bacterium]
MEAHDDVLSAARTGLPWWRRLATCEVVEPDGRERVHLRQALALGFAPLGFVRERGPCFDVVTQDLEHEHEPVTVRLFRSQFYVLRTVFDDGHLLLTSLVREPLTAESPGVTWRKGSSILQDDLEVHLDRVRSEAAAGRRPLRLGSIDRSVAAARRFYEVDAPVSLMVIPWVETLLHVAVALSTLVPLASPDHLGTGLALVTLALIARYGVPRLMRRSVRPARKRRGPPPKGPGIRLVPIAGRGRCPYCHDALGGELVRCDRCAAGHHAECWAEHADCASCPPPRVLARAGRAATGAS